MEDRVAVFRTTVRLCCVKFHKTNLNPIAEIHMQISGLEDDSD